MNNENTKYFSPKEEDLASRTSARKLRKQIEEEIAAGYHVTIDLTRVKSISESYADELFAVLVEIHNLEWFTANIKILHDSPDTYGVLRSIATAIKRRHHNIRDSINHLKTTHQYAI